MTRARLHAICKVAFEQACYERSTSPERIIEIANDIVGLKHLRQRDVRRIARIAADYAGLLQRGRLI